ncbi:hypothetical protein BDR04DRAFT_1117535 [Suillus decipiens]|nr:hypothetical protein BDR04DRAFT_1117535 [Suillus decipiens]
MHQMELVGMAWTFNGHWLVEHWAANDVIWFQNESDLLRHDTAKHGYDVRPGDIVSITQGPEFYSKGTVSSMNFLGAKLTIDTNYDQQCNLYYAILAPSALHNYQFPTTKLSLGDMDDKF